MKKKVIITGQNNFKKYGLDIHHPVFPVSAMLIFLFVFIAIAYPEEASASLDEAKWWSINSFDWLFVFSGNIFVLFCLALIVLPVGKLKIGGKDAKTEFGNFAWFSMLFSAGMGIGLMYWSVAEPVAHFTGWHHTPLNVAQRTVEAKELSMGATMFHWGLHPWAIYAVVGLSLAFFYYTKKMPLTIRVVLYPILKERTWGWPGHLVDILAVFATIFGLSTSLGLGAEQIASGLKFLFDIESSLFLQVAIVLTVTLVAVISVIKGLDKGIKNLSKINILIAIFLIVFVVVVGPTLQILKSIPETAQDYALNILSLSSFSDREDLQWYRGWTVFYWAWWIAWSPFVGMFIARISKGRTVREFMASTLLIPVGVTTVWMSVFGTTAIDQVVANVGLLSQGLTESSLAMFQMLENLPMPMITSTVAIFLVVVFFITSSDSGSLVIDSITAGGKVDLPTPQRVFWAILEGLVAAVLLYLGGKNALSALQAASIITALPFMIVLLVACFSTYIGLRDELKKGLESYG